LKPRVLTALLLLLAAADWARAEARELVLVASAKSSVATLTSIETRMIFLGYTVQRERQSLRPVRNMSDNLINEVFLQHVVAMSGVAYDRRLLVARLQLGAQRPVELASTNEVLRELERNPYAVSYLWRDQVQASRSVRILRVLWVER
jgi:hypothetical protein